MLKSRVARAPLIPCSSDSSAIRWSYLASLGLSQLRIAETEKYAHVTFFFSGGREAPFDREERILVPSPHVATYDLKPEMSCPEVTDKLVEAIAARKFDFHGVVQAFGQVVLAKFRAEFRDGDADDGIQARVMAGAVEHFLPDDDFLEIGATARIA